MGLIAKEGSNGEGSFVPVPVGMHLARCYRIVDMGTQKTTYMGQDSYKMKIKVFFEVHGEDEDGKPLVTTKGDPMSISRDYTLSLSEKATLRIDLASWRGRDFTQAELNGFDLKNILGHWAMITVTKSMGNNGKEYHNIANINPVPASIKKAGLPEGVNALKTFSIDEPDMELFDSFSQSLREKIMDTPEWKARNGDNKSQEKGGSFDDLDDDIPF